MTEWPDGWTRRPDGGAEPPRPRPVRELPPELNPRGPGRSRSRPTSAGPGGQRPGPTLPPAEGPATAVGPTLPPDVRPAAVPPPPPPSARAPRRRRRGRRLLLLLTLLVVLVLGFYAALSFWVLGHLNRVDAIRTYDGRPAAAAGATWLLVGSDSRAGLTAEQRRELRTGSSAGNRTDTIMLLHKPASGAPTLVSLPRDSWVRVPGHGRTKLNAAFSLGGAPLLVRTVEQATGMRVDDYMEVGFGGIVGMTDAVGGVRQCIPRAIKDAKSGLDVRPGCQELDGATALAYVRARYFDPQGDLGRIRRQQEYVGALMKKTVTPATVLNPLRLSAISRAGTDAVTVDEDTGVLDLVGLARALRSVSGTSGRTMTVPIADSDYRVDGQSAVRWNDAAAARLFAALRAGQQPAAVS